MLNNLSGDNNVALGANALETMTTGNANVCVGFFAGYNVAGSGNVLIGPADSGNPVNDATYSPLNPSGDRQLVIGSGTEFWVRGDSNFDVTLNNNATVNSTLTVKGDLVVNGVTTTIKSNTLEVSDKNIELAKVVSTQFTCTTADGSANISSISPTLGLIPGMVVTSNTGGVSVPNNTTIVSISSNTAVLSNNVSGTGTPTFSAIGPSDTAADGGGIILDGTTDHTFTWSNANDSWQSSENMDLVNGKTYNIIDGSGNARQLLSLTQIGPTAGTGVVSGLGSGVTSSVLTSVGTLTSLNCSGDINLVDNGTLFGGSGAANVLTLRSASGNANHSKIEVGTSEGSDNGGIHFYTAGSTVATRAITIKGTSQNVGIGEDAPSNRLVVQEAKPSDDVAIRVKNDTTTDGDATNPTTASLFLNTSTADFNTFYIQARRNDNNTHFGYADPRTVGHVPSMCVTNDGKIGINEPSPGSQLVVRAPTDDNPGITIFRNSGGGDVGSLNWQSTGIANLGRINYRGGSGNEGMQFSTYDGSSGLIEKLRIAQGASSGNSVIIGSNCSESYHNAQVSVSANTAKLLELRSSGTGVNDTNYVKRWAQNFVRATQESTHDILTLTNVSGNSHVVIELKMYCVAAANPQAGIITAYADARRTGSDSGYTLGQQTPTINFIVGTQIAVGSLAWTSNGAGGGTLKYTTDSNNNYVKYNVEITVWAHDRMNITFP